MRWKSLSSSRLAAYRKVFTLILRFSSLTRFDDAAVLIVGLWAFITLSAGRDWIRFFRSLNCSVGALAIESFAALRDVPLKSSPTIAAALSSRGTAIPAVGGGSSYA